MSKGAGRKSGKPGSPPAVAGLADDAEAVMDAIRNNQIDALVVKRGSSESILALRSIDDLAQAASQLRHAGIERRMADAARKELEVRFETLATHAPVGIFMNDADGACVYVNRRVCEIMGISDKQALDQGVVHTIHPDDRELVLRGRAQAIAERAPYETEYRYCTPDGRIVWVAAKSVALIGDGGRYLGRIGTISDVTGHKLALEALRENRGHLQVLLEERERMTQDLHDGCIQSIYGIGLSLQSCRQMLDDNPQAARTIATAAASLNLVIQELRAFISGKPLGSAGKPDLDREIERATQTWRDQGLALHTLVDPATAEALTADQAMHFLQIAREATSNATRHANARSLYIRLVTQEDLVRLEIKDDGVGFDPQALEKTGLGLHHIDARARALGGRSSIQSTRGSGTCVVVQVPIKR